MDTIKVLTQDLKVGDELCTPNEWREYYPYFKITYLTIYTAMVEVYSGREYMNLPIHDLVTIHRPAQV